jgi:hypothetical protein
MEYFLWIIAILAGVILGRASAPQQNPEELERCNTQRSQQEIDLAYYKKLTRTLVEENTELRKKINDPS